MMQRRHRDLDRDVYRDRDAFTSAKQTQTSTPSKSRSLSTHGADRQQAFSPKRTQSMRNAHAGAHITRSRSCEPLGGDIDTDKSMFNALESEGAFEKPQ